MSHKIARVKATAIAVPINFAQFGNDRVRPNSMCLAEVETEDGLVGHGITSITQGTVIAKMINDVAGPAIIGAEALAHERVWQTLYWTLTPWGQSGQGSHAIAAIDLALWDIKGKAFGEPLWRLIGGTRDRIEAYATCGFSFFDQEQLTNAVTAMVSEGYRALKMQVGRPGLDRRNTTKTIAQMIESDVERVGWVREAVGPDVEISVDAGCRLDLPSAVDLARRLEPLNVACFEEPIMQNDVHLLADMRRRTAIPLSAGQNEGQAYRFRDMLQAGAVDIVQPNAIITGGMTQCLKIAGMAAAFNTPISNGGGCPYHNMHLQAGVANGTTIEYQLNSAGACQMIFDGLPEIVDGWIDLPEAPGLGFSPNAEAIAEYAIG
ncbi:MAG: mandelate racemase/muconate lactonizing enzyme family protein [Alphaproteobacteria bacterium]|nr:mandelate racemase/muconate lactonizing enzyme family protein [Alphaproteobacteria bacterium]